MPRKAAAAINFSRSFLAGNASLRFCSCVICHLVKLRVFRRPPPTLDLSPAGDQRKIAALTGCTSFRSIENVPFPRVDSDQTSSFRGPSADQARLFFLTKL